MKFFYISTVPNDNGKFEIHEHNCVHRPDLIDLEYLGPFNNGSEAMRKALLKNPKAVTCQHCCTSSFRPSFSRVREDKVL